MKILVVEDEHIIAENLKEQLEDFGYEDTIIVHDADSAIQTFKSNQPDLVLMDVHLAQSSKDGIEIAGEISKLRDVPIIYLTAFDDKETFERAKETRPANFLLKPWNTKQLEVAIKMAIDQFCNVETAEEEEEQNFIPYDDFFFTKRKTRFTKVEVKDILFVKASGSSVEIFTNKERLVITANLKSFSKQIQHNALVRVQKSYVINLFKIKSFEENFIFIDNNGTEERIPIGAKFKKDFFLRIKRLKAD